ncbi:MULTISPECIES: nuclear transport factor 2 family protein [unclassified Pseudomonas]|uniref:nuclear transport factor 2 family protein n=1 Tax=unclassified Pseudomonas TaxID=196821 RepID=UPI002458E072|nr:MULTISPECIES: nuclear transport factor 2 family protein [unclassified Pseudomonas]
MTNFDKGRTMVQNKKEGIHMSDIERRLKALEDRAELQDLAVRYFVATDDDDFATLEALFAPGAEFHAGGFAGGTDRAAIMAFLRSARANMGITIHTPHYSLITFTGDDTATGVVGAHLEIAMAGQSLFGAVRYYDKYQRLHGKWHFSKREMLAVHMGPWEQVATSLTADLRVRWPGGEPQAADLPARRENL